MAVKNYIDKLNSKDITFITGMAKSGADALIIRWCEEHDYPWVGFPADWDKHKKAAGYVRNVEMADEGTHLLAFWDTISRGTKHMIDIAGKKDLDVTIIVIDTPLNGGHEILHQAK